MAALARWFIPLLTSTLVLLAQGCNITALTMDEPTATPSPINPQAILDECGRTMSALNYFHFLLEHNDGGTLLSRGMTLTEASGKVANPDRIAVDFRGTAGRFAMKGSLIAVGGDVYMTNPLSDEWLAVASANSPLEFFDPSRGIEGILAQVRDVALISHDTAAYRISGTLPADALTPLFGKTDAESSIDVSLTIDKAHLYLTQARLDGRITPAEADGIVRTITLSQFNEPVDISSPNLE